MIIDQYLAEDAVHYINMEGHTVAQIIGEYERQCMRGTDEFDARLFDDSTRNVRVKDDDEK